jgi:predicted amidohydrolase
MKTIRVAAASVRNLIGEVDRSIADVQRWVERAAGQGAELILFPELNIGGHVRGSIVNDLAEPVPGPSTERIIRIAGEAGIIIAFGILERCREVLHCSHVLVNGSGVLGKQRKIHVPAQEQPYWSAGSCIDVFDIGGIKLGVCICRDSFFDEMTRTLYFKGAEVVLMPFGYYNVPRSEYLKGTIHGMSIVKASWANGFYAVVCNSAESRGPNDWEPTGRRFPGWAGVLNPWGEVVCFVDSEGNDESLIVAELDPEVLKDRRCHPNFLARELRPELYRFS